LKKIIIALPGWLLCGFIMILQIENKHYGFEKPGLDHDSILMIVIFSVFAIGYALIALFLSHKGKLDFALQYITLTLVIYKLIQIVFLFSSYYWAL
jgi:hypothetical protein